MKVTREVDLVQFWPKSRSNNFLDSMQLSGKCCAWTVLLSMGIEVGMKLSGKSKISLVTGMGRYGDRK